MVIFWNLKAAVASTFFKRLYEGNKMNIKSKKFKNENILCSLTCSWKYSRRRKLSRLFPLLCMSSFHELNLFSYVTDVSGSILNEWTQGVLKFINFFMCFSTSYHIELKDLCKNYMNILKKRNSACISFAFFLHLFVQLCCYN